MKLGFVGLGKMGNRMVVKLLTEEHEVVVWNRTREKISLLRHQLRQGFDGQEGFEGQANLKNNLFESDSIEDLVKKLDTPRIIWLMLPAGEATEEILSEVGKHVESLDIVIDGGNSFYEDTQKRFEHFRQKGIKFLGIGVSGGLIAAREGYPLMVGGNRQAYDQIKPILDSLAKPNGGHEFFGEGGAGHFVKMVHNAIEYGVMQSIGEGFGVLEKSPYNLDLLKVAKLYQKGTLVSGFMMERTVEALENDPGLKSIDGIIGKASGETIWAVELAKKLNLPVDIIERSLQIRNESETNHSIQKSFAARLVAALRAAFGGHEVKKRED